MRIENSNLEKFKDRNPFRVPDGYFENFTAKMMSSLPEKPVPEKVVVISMYDRIKPWLYMAAAFAGLMVLFSVLRPERSSQGADKAQVTLPATEAVDADSEFFDSIADMYADKYAMSYIDDYISDN
ncbi:MAG: hypothetical protein LBT35_06520 [Tannerella sp.]|jgi:hypothetical protein|nr:hypothetical protein [Tannerella sp.]